jgi:diguanylate cyclase (GGDEF)-like protein
VSDELEHSRRELYWARKRIAELTRSQLEMSGTVGRLTEMASTDLLTGLCNRRRFMEALQAAFQAADHRETPLSVVMIDIDSFKSYNDSFGHPAGDQVLWAVAKLLLRTSGADHVVSRYGGEEFTILLPSTDLTQAMEFAEKQRAAIASYPWPLRPVSASFGVATLGPTITIPPTLVEEADRALYHSKDGGRNRVTHFQSLDALGALSNAPEGERTDSSRPPGEAVGRGLDREPTGRIDTNSEAGIEMPNPVNRPRPILGELTPRPEKAEASWDVLERFLQVLRSGKTVPDQYRIVLSSIREATEAEIVFLCNEQTGDMLEAVGDHVPSPQWYHQFTRRLVDDLPRGGLWKRAEDALDHPSTVVPEPSVAIVLPVETPRPSWLVALRFRDASAYLASDLKVVRVIWQLHLHHHRHDRVYDNLKETLFGVVRCLSTAIDAKDPHTCGHSERVARIAVRLGEEMGLGRGEISDLYLAGLLHDVGKIGVRDEVLRKEGPLTEEEYLHIQEHPAIGDRIISNVTRLAYLRPGVRGHHERYDGKGYPDGLAGGAIPQMARILAVADSCDAMMSVRSYRSALSQARIEEIFEQGSGSQWDPRIVEHFFNCRQQLYAVIQRGLGQSVYKAVERAVSIGDRQDRGAQSIHRREGQLLGKTV